MEFVTSELVELESGGSFMVKTEDSCEVGLETGPRHD